MLLVGGVGCARQAVSSPTLVEPYVVPSLQAERLASLEGKAPELAAHIRRLHALGEQRGLEGQRELAQEIATLAEVSLLSAELAFAEVDCPEAEEPEAPPAPRDEAVRDERPRRRAPATRETPVAETNESAPTQANALLRERLAEMVAVLGQVEPGPQVEQVRRILLEADRALADGLTERAGELMEEARALLSGTQMRRVSDEEAFHRDARERLGARALRRGSRLLVRLNDLVRFSDGRWNSRNVGVFNDLRALARVYGGERLILVHVAEDDDSVFVREEERLVGYLLDRMQLPAQRLRVAGRQSNGSSGTYLVFRPGSE